MTDPSRATGTVTLTGLVKRYGSTLALDGVSLAVARASSSRSSDRPDAARPPRCARWPASSRRMPGTWRSTAASSTGSPRTGAASGWCSSTTPSSRTAPSSRTSASASACSAWTRRRSPGGWPRPSPSSSSGPRRALSRPALGRRAAARGAGASARHRAPRSSARRAARRARQEAARPHEDRAQAPAARGRDHHDLRDPRPGGGAHDVRPHRGDEPRACRAGGRAARALRAPPTAFVAGFIGNHQPAVRPRRRVEQRRLWHRHLAATGAAPSGAAVAVALRPERMRLDPSDAVDTLLAMTVAARRLPGRDRPLHPEERSRARAAGPRARRGALRACPRARRLGGRRRRIIQEEPA